MSPSQLSYVVRWKSALISRVNLASQKNRDVVWHVQEKNCRINFFHINNYWACVLGYYSTVWVPAREIWTQRLVAAGQHLSTCVNKYQEFPTQTFQWAFAFHQLPLRRPDLSLLNFFLWCYIKNHVYTAAPPNLVELKGNIAQEIKNIDQKTLKLIILNLMKRRQICNANSDGRFQHLL